LNTLGEFREYGLTLFAGIGDRIATSNGELAMNCPQSCVTHSQLNRSFAGDGINHLSKQPVPRGLKARAAEELSKINEHMETRLQDIATAY